MGIDREISWLLFSEAQKRPFQGSVLQLGKQDILLPNAQLKKLSRMSRAQRKRYEDLEDYAFVSDVEYFKRLGFSEVYSLDNSGYEGADFLFDMNRQDVPDNLRSRFDVVFDGGTMEHVFHTPQFLANAFAMLKPGGRIVHLSPTFNHINHGFFCYSPTFFIDYYRANQFLLHDVLLLKRTVWRAWVCDCLDAATNSLIDQLAGIRGAYYTFAVATKTEKSSSGAIPQQGSYVSVWGNCGDAPEQAAPGLHGRLKGLYRGATTNKNTFFYALSLRVRRVFLNSWIYKRYIDKSVNWRRI